MKKLLVFVLTLMMVGLFMGCDDTETVATSDNSTVNNEFSQTMTVQGTIYDATNGARLTGSSLSIIMTRGATNYSPAVLKNGTSETTFAGDYAFTYIPITLNNEVTYRVIITMDGYQTYETYVTATTNAKPTRAGDNNTIDTVYNMVGNVFLFPLGETAEDINIYVEYNNERVTGATVQLQQLVANSTATAQTNNAMAAAVNGTLPDLITTTDANGLATFAGSGLVLGGRYDVVVLPMVYEGTQLALDTGVTAIDVGTDIATRVVMMEDTAPGAEDNGLYIVNASNHDGEDLAPTGVLTVVFSKPVGINAERTFTAALTNATHAVLDTDTVAATMSADNLTMTLTPQFTTAGYVNPYAGPNSNGNGVLGTGLADINLSITYTGGTVYLLGDNTDDAMTFLTGGPDTIKYLDGTDVSQVVQMTNSVDD
jgi:hypothetical protein